MTSVLVINMQLPFLLIFKLDLLFCRPKLNQPLVVPIAAGGSNRHAVENRLNALEVVLWGNRYGEKKLVLYINYMGMIFRFRL